MKNFNEFINEGSWTLPNDTKEYSNFAKEIKELKKKYYNVIGDDEVFDGLDNALSRLEELEKFATEKKNKEKEDKEKDKESKEEDKEDEDAEDDDKEDK
jgi:hypothetical protein